jgi:hypothetical protein
VRFVSKAISPSRGRWCVGRAGGQLTGARPAPDSYLDSYPIRGLQRPLQKSTTPKVKPAVSADRELTYLQAWGIMMDLQAESLVRPLI